MAFSEQDCMCMDLPFLKQSNDNHQVYHVPHGNQYPIGKTQWNISKTWKIELLMNMVLILLFKYFLKII